MSCRCCRRAQGGFYSEYECIHKFIRRTLFGVLENTLSVRGSLTLLRQARSPPPPAHPSLPVTIINRSETSCHSARCCGHNGNHEEERELLEILAYILAGVLNGAGMLKGNPVLVAAVACLRSEAVDEALKASHLLLFRLILGLRSPKKNGNEKNRQNKLDICIAIYLSIQVQQIWHGMSDTSLAFTLSQLQQSSHTINKSFGPERQILLRGT